MQVTSQTKNYCKSVFSNISTITLEEKQKIESSVIKEIIKPNDYENSELNLDLDLEFALQNFLAINDNNIDKLVDASAFNITGISETQSRAISLLQISIYAKRYDYAKIILAKDANPDVQMLDGSTALHLATKTRQDDTIELLLAKGASTIIYDNTGSLPMHVAYNNLDIDTIELLVAHKTNDINMPNKNGLTVLHMVCLKTVNTLEKEEIAQILLSREDINVNCKTTEGFAPLHFVSDHNAELAKMLLEKNAMVDIKTNTSITPLMRACKTKNNNETIQLLLQNQADVHIRETSLGWQAIHFASVNDNADTIDLLLQYGADVNSRAFFFRGGGVTPLILALKYKHNVLAEYLLAYKGAELNLRGTDEIVGCFSDVNDKSGVLSTIVCTLFCGWALPFFPCFDPEDKDSIKEIWNASSSARNTMFPCLRPTAKSFITDPGLLERVKSVKNRVITEEPKESRLQSLKAKLTNNLYSYIELPKEDN